MPILLLLVAVACAPPDQATDPSPATESPSPSSPKETSGEAGGIGADVPRPDTTEMEPQVKRRIDETRSAVLAAPESAEAWGRFGMVCHAHEIWAEAVVAYGRAEALDPEDVRWPYFLGDVLNIVGTDLEAAERELLRALELKQGYGPIHMRLGQVLSAADRLDESEAQFLRALELASDLQPARVGLAQIRLSQDRLDSAVELLEAVLAEHPRHSQALSALGQAYNRQGRRDEARAIALRARDASDYNLYSDPLMSEVVREGVSSVLVWERAKAYLDNGNYQQAELGLKRVLGLRPDDADVHHQLAYTYEQLGEIESSRRHLERVVELDPGRLDARMQLGSIHLEQGRAAEALAHLRLAHEGDRGDRQVAWLYGRALALTGSLDPALVLFRATAEAAAAAGEAVPVAVRNVWGSSLAQGGQFREALEHFYAALEVEPRNGQSLFYCGLSMEGLGRPTEAVTYYRRALEVDPNPMVLGRLRALGEPVSR